jgi:hypothetical protein
MVSEEGTETLPELLLESETIAPPAGAGPLVKAMPPFEDRLKNTVVAKGGVESSCVQTT